jgi:hypothetical protein
LTQLAVLPNGSFVAHEGQPYLVFNSTLRAWRPDGYGAPMLLPLEAILRVLTPRSVVRVLAHAYPVEIHPSAFQSL